MVALFNIPSKRQLASGLLAGVVAGQLPTASQCIGMAKGPIAIALAVGASLWIARGIARNADWTPLLDWSREVLTATLAHYNRIEMDRHRLAKSTLMSLAMPEASEVPGHAHPMSASGRTTSAGYLAAICTTLGRRAFHYQMSRREQLNGEDGSRQFYWSKDVVIEARNCEPKPDQVVCLTDVDYHVDMPRLLARRPQTHLLYTMIPEFAAYVGRDMTYTFDSHGRLHARYQGGQPYVHELWDYSTDTIVVTNTFLGLPTSTTLYAVETRRMAQDRAIVLLEPTGHWRGPLLACLAWFLASPKLRRLNPVQHMPARPDLKPPLKACAFTRLTIFRGGQLLTSTAECGKYLCATIPAELDASLHIAAERSVHGLLEYAVCTRVKKDVLGEGAPVLAKYHSYACDATSAFVAPCDRDVHGYVTLYGRDVERWHVPMEAFMAPIYDNAWVPISCQESERRAIEGRVLAFQHRAIPPLSTIDHQHMLEFLQHIFPREHMLCPHAHDTIVDRLNRPSQRNLIEEGLAYGDEGPRDVSSFVKVEAYAKPTEPRPISTLSPDIKTRWSAFTYSLADALANLEITALNKTPREVCLRVAQLCLNAESHVLISDHSRFDGHVNEKIRLFEDALMRRAFRPEFHTEAESLMRRQRQQAARTRRGFRYTTGDTRLSGSPETSIFNTLANAFVAYCGLRTSRSPEAAFLSLGVYLGDDGVSPDLIPSHAVEAATRWGFSLDICGVNRGDVGVEFLSRIYGPGVWHGDPNSMADLQRVLAKFHATRRLPGVTAETKLIEKLAGYAFSDPDTPILSELIATVSHHRPVLAGLDSDHGLRSYGFVPDLARQYVNRREDWMFEYLERSLPGFPVSSYLACLGIARGLRDIMSIRFTKFTPQRVSHAYIVDQELIPAAEETL